MKKRLKINGVIIFVAFVLIIVFPATFFRRPSNSLFDETIALFGLSVIMLGQILRVSGRGFKAEHSQSGSNLIQAGPYALVRNPMYLGILLIGLGVVMMLFKWWVAIVFLLIFIARYISLIFTEEKKLEVLFPGDYPGYKQRVPRILPAASSLFKKDIAVYLPVKLSWLEKEIGSMLALLFIAICVKSWQDFRAKGLVGCLKEAAGIAAIVIFFTGLVVYLTKQTARLEKDVSN